MKGVFGWNASRTYNGWSFNKPPDKLIGENMSEKSPRLKPTEKINPNVGSVLSHRTMETPVLNADEQRAIGQLSLRDDGDIGAGKGFPGVAREPYEPPFNVFGVGEWNMDDPRDLAENQDF